MLHTHTPTHTVELYFQSRTLGKVSNKQTCNCVCVIIQGSFRPTEEKQTPFGFTDRTWILFTHTHTHTVHVRWLREVRASKFLRRRETKSLTRGEVEDVLTGASTYGISSEVGQQPGFSTPVPCVSPGTGGQPSLRPLRRRRRRRLPKPGTSEKPLPGWLLSPVGPGRCL